MYAVEAKIDGLLLKPSLATASPTISHGLARNCTRETRDQEDSISEAFLKVANDDVGLQATTLAHTSLQGVPKSGGDSNGSFVGCQ